MTILQRLLIAGLAGATFAMATPAAAVDGIRPGCPGWFDPISYVVCVGRPGSHVRHHYHYRHTPST